MILVSSADNDKKAPSRHKVTLKMLLHFPVFKVLL